MPRQCPTQRDPGPARPAWPGLARRCVLACAFAAMMAAGPALAGGSAAAAVTSRGAVTSGTLIAGAGTAGTVRTADSRTAAAAAQHVTIGISSVNPTIAVPGRAITVQGTVSNRTRSAVSSLTIQLWSSSTALGSRAALSEYAAGNMPG